MMAHQKLSNARDFGTDEAGKPYTPEAMECLNGELGAVVKEAMGQIAIGKETIKQGMSSGAGSSGGAKIIVPATPRW